MLHGLQRFTKAAFGLIAVSISLIHSSALAESPIGLTEIWRMDSELNRPESVTYDAQTNALYVSCIVGKGADKDGNGYIAKVSLQGKLLNKRWATGLDGPKGLAIDNGILYASDIDRLVAIDINSGKIVAKYPAEGATFLNDVAIDAKGTVYVSDSRSSLIYRLKNGKLSLWLNNTHLRSPNGLYAESDFLLIAAADATRTEDPSKARYLQTLKYDGSVLKPLYNNKPIGGIDAIESDHAGGYFLSDWPMGGLMHIDQNGQVTQLLTLNKGTADLDFVAATQMLYLPLMLDNTLVAYKVDGLR